MTSDHIEGYACPVLVLKPSKSYHYPNFYLVNSLGMIPTNLSIPVMLPYIIFQTLRKELKKKMVEYFLQT